VPGNTPNGPVCAQASTHNLSYLLAFNGNVATNTW
jgi:hypothetical protein